MTSETAPREAVLEILDKDITDVRDNIESWAAKLIEDPDYALRWSDNTFQLGARWKVLVTLRNVVAGKPEGAHICCTELREWALREALRHARHPERSTSVASNMMHQCAGEVWADVADEKFGTIIDRATWAAERAAKRAAM